MVGLEPALVASGGIAGSLLRWQVTVLSEKLKLNPYSTIAVNTLGSFLLGATSQLTKNDVFSKQHLLLLGTGFCGSFTTFSTFSVDVVKFIEAGKYGNAFTIVALTNVFGIAAALAGVKLFKKVVIK